jgi:hypothetical protein
MADKKTYSDNEKIAYFRKRINDKSLSEKQREYALKMVAKLTGVVVTQIDNDDSVKSAPVSAAGSQKPPLVVQVKLTRTKNGKPWATSTIVKDDPNA